jgi:predicted site-specific integrase-resolvase
VTLRLAMAGATVTTRFFNIDTKTYYVYDRAGTLRPVSKEHNSAYYVKGPNQEILAGRSLNNTDYRLILYQHDPSAEIYHVSNW